MDRQPHDESHDPFVVDQSTEPLGISVGVATGIFTAEQLTSAGAEIVIPDLTDADEILKMIFNPN